MLGAEGEDTTLKLEALEAEALQTMLEQCLPRAVQALQATTRQRDHDGEDYHVHYTGIKETTSILFFQFNDDVQLIIFMI